MAMLQKGYRSREGEEDGFYLPFPQGFKFKSGDTVFYKSAVGDDQEHLGGDRRMSWIRARVDLGLIGFDSGGTSTPATGPTIAFGQRFGCGRIACGRGSH
ncbi:hypothetical protein P7F88_25310 [Vibrio hannami]|uniref:hypothetical protein n=1 Tax=Vibrio hannami TaxID=2717094 RepID=UPI002410653F|nr:hypothetical protein [Vibrio hannami]MDG3089184.1 hypothetical protein [Vibrio hannami]